MKSNNNHVVHDDNPRANDGAYLELGDMGVNETVITSRLSQDSHVPLHSPRLPHTDDNEKYNNNNNNNNNNNIITNHSSEANQGRKVGESGIIKTVNVDVR